MKIYVSNVADTCYCEAKAVLDLHGKAKYGANARRERERLGRGTRAHAGFEREQHRDSRCFIASAVYGPTAYETNCLRVWRDNYLMQCWHGRTLVRVYYATSPAIARLVSRRPGLARLARVILNRILSVLP